MSVRVKICGITNYDDAKAAIDAGADALGFIFYSKSARYISIEQAAAISCRLPPFIIRVGVFVNAPEEEVRMTQTVCNLDRLQFHGDESPVYVSRFGCQAIRAFRISTVDSLGQLISFRSAAWLLDSYVPGQLGGTGATFNWELAQKVVTKHPEHPLVLAGGLTVDNVEEAVRQVKPYGVDVSSGVESAPGRKDHAKIVEFIRRVRSVQGTSNLAHS